MHLGTGSSEGLFQQLLIAHDAQGRATERYRVTAAGRRYANAQYIGLRQGYCKKRSQCCSDAAFVKQGDTFEFHIETFLVSMRLVCYAARCFLSASVFGERVSGLGLSAWLKRPSTPTGTSPSMVVRRTMRGASP
ncbi:hypothetical protein D3C84_740010 [compost metagenome]